MMCPYKWQPVDMSVPVLFPENYAFVDVFDALMGRENTDMEDLLQEVLGIHRSSFEAYPKHMGVLLFSNPVKDNFLQHAALGHELGHFADRVHKVRDSISETTLVAAQRIIDADRDQLVDEFLEARLGKDTKARAKGSEDYESVRLKLVAYLNDELQKLNDSWQGEIIADVFAIRLLGPAAFFAIGQYLLMHLGPLRRAALSSTTHPSVLLRLKVMIRELDDLLTDITFRDDARILAEAIEEWRELVTDLSAQAMPPSGRLDLSGTNWGRTQLEVGLADRIYAHLESTGVLQSMQDEIRQVITRVGDVPGHRWLLPSSHDFDQLPYAIRMLRLGVPPSEKPRDLKAKLLETADVTAPCLSLATILNTGWAYEFERWREPTSWSCPDDVIQFFQGRQERLDSVVKCAVEQSNLVRKTYGS